MATESIGALIPTAIPGYTDAADIQAALRAYHYGSYSYDPANTSPASLVTPSIAKTIYDLQNSASSAVTLDGVQTLTNKTLTSPIVSGLYLSDSSITIEGASTNIYETTLTVTDPTDDRTITFPDASGNVVLDTLAQTLTNKTLTAPKFADLGFIADANGNELIVMDTVASAINEITIANAVTSAAPTITASGDDTNISLNLVAKGSGTVQAGGVPVVTTTGSQTLTNKTLTSPVISSISNTGTLTLPTSTDTLVGRATTDTLTNKTLTSPVISTISNTGTLTLPTSTDTLVGRDTTDTLTNKTLTAPIINLAINAQTGTTFTPALTDNGKLVTLSNAAAISLTVPTNTSVAYAIGAQINLFQLGAGQVTVAGDTGVTVYGTPGLKFRAQYSAATLIKLDTNTWLLSGDLSA